MIVKLIIEYDGTGYVGWQKQKNGKSIQGEIENSLNKIFDKNIKLFVAGRTDAGVHALGQVAHFEVDTKIEPKKIGLAINHYLGKENKIVIKKSSKENNKFHTSFIFPRNLVNLQEDHGKSIAKNLWIHCSFHWFWPEGAEMVKLGENWWNLLKCTKLLEISWNYQ